MEKDNKLIFELPLTIRMVYELKKGEAYCDELDNCLSENNITSTKEDDSNSRDNTVYSTRVA